MQKFPDNFTHLGVEKSLPYASDSPVAGLTRLVCRMILKITGWKVLGELPQIPKAVIVAGPHTSNLDGFYMVVTGGLIRKRFSWVGKAALVKGPFGGIVKWTGCIPIERGSNQGLVAQMVEAFAMREELFLAVAPEGTRSAVEGWKTGFYHIAEQAGVPILLAIMDYGTSSIRFDGLLHPSGDADKDIAYIKTRYASAKGRYPE